MDEENEVLEAIEMQTKAVETRMGGVDAELKKLRADLTKSDRDNAELERKVNMLSIAQPATGTADGNKAPPHELFNLQVKSNFGPSRSALNAEAFAEYKAAFNKWIRYGDRFLDGAEQKAMSVGVDTDGGYLAPPEYARQIIKVEQLNSVMRGLVTAIPMGAGSLELPASTGLPTAGWVGETEPRPATATSPIGKLEIFAKEIYAEPEVTQTLLDDAAFDIESFLGGLVGDAFAVAEDAAFISGNGVKVPQGFLTYSTSNKTDLSGTRNFGEIQYVASGQAGAWPSTDDAIYDFLVDIVMALKPGYRRNASWVMPTSVIQKVMKIKDAQKQPASPADCWVIRSPRRNRCRSSQRIRTRSPSRTGSGPTGSLIATEFGCSETRIPTSRSFGSIRPSEWAAASSIVWQSNSASSLHRKTCRRQPGLTSTPAAGGGQLDRVTERSFR
jgi:HK97 family phage major capsid protein